MAVRRYTVVLSPEPEGSAWNVTVPALPGCFTFGATVEEALAMARDAVAAYLDGEDADTLPGEPAGVLVATVEVEVAAVGGTLRAAAPVGA